MLESHISSHLPTWRTAVVFVNVLKTRFPPSITFMGGAIGVGNTGPCAEFNIQNDPEAAKIVCDSGIKVQSWCDGVLKTSSLHLYLG